MNGHIETSVGKEDLEPRGFGLVIHSEYLVSILLQNTHSVTLSCFSRVCIVLISQSVVYSLSRIFYTEGTLTLTHLSFLLCATLRNLLC